MLLNDQRITRTRRGVGFRKLVLRRCDQTLRGATCVLWLLSSIAFTLVVLRPRSLLWAGPIRSKRRRSKPLLLQFAQRCVRGRGGCRFIARTKVAWVGFSKDWRCRSVRVAHHMWLLADARVVGMERGCRGPSYSSIDDCMHTHTHTFVKENMCTRRCTRMVADAPYRR